MTIPSDSVPFPGATPRPVGFYWIRTYGQVQHETVYGDVVSRWTGTEWESPRPVLDLEPIPAMDELRALRTERDALAKEVQRLDGVVRSYHDTVSEMLECAGIDFSDLDAAKAAMDAHGPKPPDTIRAVIRGLKDEVQRLREALEAVRPGIYGFAKYDCDNQEWAKGSLEIIDAALPRVS
jgi:hypothetical protein